MHEKTVVVVANSPDSLAIMRSNLIKTMLANGHRVFACAPAKNRLTNLLCLDPVGDLEALGAKFIDIPMDGTGRNPIKDLKLLFDFFRVFKKLNADVVLTTTPKPVIFGTVAARMAGVETICPLINGIPYGMREEKDWVRPIGRILLALYSWALKRASTTIFQNKDDLQLFGKLHLISQDQATAVVNGSGVDTEHYAPVPLPVGETVFLLIARLNWDKGIREYFEAAKLVRSRGYEARWLLVGPMDDHPVAISQEDLDELQKLTPIEYLGPLAEVRPAIAQSNVYVIQSYREGTSRASLEAMSMGRAIITTDAPGCRESVIPNVNGLMVAVKDAESTAEAMINMIRNPEMREEMGRESRKLALDRFSVDKVTASMLSAMNVPVKEIQVASSGPMSLL